MLQPGDLEWFRAAAARCACPTETGPRAPVRRGAVVGGGYDPAANYRPFEEQVERLDARVGPR